MGFATFVLVLTEAINMMNAGPVVSNCNPAKYSQRSPQSVFPPSYLEEPQLDDIQQWFKIGLNECQVHYEKQRKQYAIAKLGPPLSLDAPHDRNELCRGNEMVYQTTGLLVWPFGPISNCPTYSECWFGLLSCGEFNSNGLQNLMKAGPKQVGKENLEAFPEFKGWTIRSLEANIRIAGPEILVPQSRHLSWTNASFGSVEALIYRYTLTIPGKYSIEMRLQSIYPGLLYAWSASARSRGAETYHSIFLGGCEGRCPPYQNCGPYNIPACDQKSFVIGSPFALEAQDASSACSLPKSPLPFCSSGNHTGRWLRVPDHILTICGVDPFRSALIAEKERQRGKRQDFNKYTAIMSAYVKHSQEVDPREVLGYLQTAAHSGGSKHHQVHLDTLIKYANGNLCSLAHIEDPHSSLDGSLDVFAPYDCRYQLFSSALVNSLIS
jgi:hypothetical protein